MQILLVEDDRPLASGLQTALKKEGYVINHVETGRAALHAVQVVRPDMVVLDIGLPDVDGLSVLKQIRKRDHELPVLLLTARDSVDDKVTGLDCGADDYLPKPFEMDELLARLRVLERRLKTVKSPEIRIGSVTLNTKDHRVMVGDQELELGRREYMLLKSLMENAGRIQTRSTLENHLYDWNEEVASNALEVHVHHLRKKLGNEFIKTIRGVGYKIAAESQA